jgi:hypothetical protein
VGVAVTGGNLHQAERIAPEAQAEGLGINGDGGNAGENAGRSPIWRWLAKFSLS